MQRAWATHFAVAGTAVHCREDELGQHHEDQKPGLTVSLCPGVFCLCALTSLLLPMLLDLKGFGTLF